ncbi:MAG: hypothetical protein OJF50_000503 [Nitrospira sp.]|nr:hypothetical protein [Nitrospira sp.]
MANIFSFHTTATIRQNWILSVELYGREHVVIVRTDIPREHAYTEL